MNRKLEPTSGADAPPTPARRRQAFNRAFWVGVGFAGYAWCFACVRLEFAGQAGSAASALFLCLLAGALLGVGLGVFWAMGFSALSPRNLLGRATEHLALAVAEPRVVGLATLAHWYSGWLLLCGTAGLSFFLVRHAVLSMARPENVALAAVGIELGLTLCALLAFRPLAAALRRGLVRLSARFPNQRLLDVRGHFALLALALAALACFVCLEYRHVLGALDWATLATTVLALFVSITTVAWVSRARPWVRLALGLSVLASFLTTGLWAAGAGQHSRAAAERASEHVMQARWGFSALTLLLDRDADGHLDSFGGNDCAPLDRAIHPGALETPGNGVDEDCDGADPVRSPTTHARLLPEKLARDQRPIAANLYLLSVDAFASDVLSAYGGTRPVMPNLERLARRSVVFRHYFSQGPSTRLSLPSLFTSRFDSGIARVVEGRFPFELSPSNLTIAEVLAEAGYVTGAILPHPYFTAERWRGLTQGFAHVDSLPARAHSDEVPHTARLVSDRAILFSTRFQSRPRFLWAHYFDAHPPHDPPVGSAQAAGEYAAYLAEMTHVDHELGRLVDHILEHDTDPLIVITGDHGIAFDEPRHRQVRYGHDLSTAVLRVPLLVHSPALKPARLDDLVNGLDLAPTLAQLGGVSRWLPFEGRSLLPRLLGEPQRLAQVQFAQLYLPEELLRGRDALKLVSVRDDQYNLVLDRHSGKVEAWNWRNDSTERHELWSRTAQEKSARAARLRSLKATLDNFVIDCRAVRHGVSSRVP